MLKWHVSEKLICHHACFKFINKKQFKPLTKLSNNSLKLNSKFQFKLQVNIILHVVGGQPY